eukprot:gene16062-7410_t
MQLPSYRCLSGLLDEETYGDTSSTEEINTQSGGQDTDESLVNADSLKLSVKERKQMMVDFLKDRRTGKLSKRNSLEAQLIDITREEFQLKKRALEKIEEGEKSHKENIKTFSVTMASLKQVISNGFAALQGASSHQTPVKQGRAFGGMSFNQYNSQIHQRSQNQGSFSEFLNDDQF